MMFAYMKHSGRNPVRRSRTSALAFLLSMAVASSGYSDARADAKGKDKKAKSKTTITAESIIENMIDMDPLGYGGAEAHLLMMLINDREQKRKRKLTMMSRTDGDTRRTFVRFSAPADISGTSFLGIDNDGDRVQHLYLPALAKTRRISNSQRNGSFVGTDYSYADLDNRDVKESAKTRLPDENVGKTPCYVIEALPSDSKSAYGKIVLWIHQTTWLPLRIRFYNQSGKESKRLTVQEIKKVKQRWVIFQSKMVDLKRQHSTIMKVQNITLRDDVPLEQFTVRSLERG